MPGKKDWEESESEESSSEESSSSPKLGAVRRGKFDDEEGEESDVLDSWDAAEDSEVEREKAKKAAEAKAKADADAKANHKSKTARMKDHIAERQRLKDEEDEEEDSDEETETQKRERLRRTEKEADLKNAEDLFGGEVGMISSAKRTNNLPGSAVSIDPKDPTKTVDIASLALFNPTTKLQFENLRNIVGPIIANNSKKAHYALFLTEFAKQLAKDLPSEQIKKIGSGLTTLSNEKMKEEKAADKSGKKTKAAKSKTTLAIARPGASADTSTYEDAAFGDDDFM